MNGRLDCVQLLLRHGARANVACSGARHTVLHVAAANRHRGVVECLVEAGASIEAQNAHGNTPLHSAAATGTLEVMTVRNIFPSSFVVAVSSRTYHFHYCILETGLGLGKLAPQTGRLNLQLKSISQVLTMN